MARFVVRSIISTIVTLFLVSIALFFLMEVGSGDIAVRILGIYSTPEQRTSFRAQLGLNTPTWKRYVYWLVGSDWRAESLVGYSLMTLPNPQSGEKEWWADVDGQPTRWKMIEGELKKVVRIQKKASTIVSDATERWKKDEKGQEYLWAVDTKNNAVKWIRRAETTYWVKSQGGVITKRSGGAQEYLPLLKGLLRGDPGMSIMYNRPVSHLILPRIRNTLMLAGAAFAIVMPIALFLGILAGINEGKWLDRVISVTGLGITAIPEFVTGIFLILFFGVWLKVLPAVTLFTSSTAVFQNPKMLVLPVLTLSAIELGYVARMTRASMVEVMDSDYIRTAVVKGMPYWRIVILHAIRNALMAPITVIMLHVNWLIGGVVVTEIIFGYPGLGKFIYDAALFGDISAIEAAAMVTVSIAIGTRLVGDMLYTFLNPRIRYA